MCTLCKLVLFLYSMFIKSKQCKLEKTFCKVFKLFPQVLLWFGFGWDKIWSLFTHGLDSPLEPDCALGASVGTSARQGLLGVVGGPAHDPRVDVGPLAAGAWMTVR